MFMLIWNNIARRRTQSTLTVTITALTVLVFVMVMGIFQTVNQGLALSQERLGADAILMPKYSSAEGDDLLFTAMPVNSCQMFGYKNPPGGFPVFRYWLL